MTNRKKLIAAVALMLVAGLQFGCSEISREDSPVLLVISATQVLSVVDIASNDSDCDGDVVLLQFRNIVKRPDVADARFLDIRLHTVRRTYRRTDGGTVVPSPFVRSIGALIPATGAAASIGSSIIIEPDALSRPPFAALLASEFGLDPETGRAFVAFSITEEYFGETLAGDKVSASITYPLTICAGCGGCG